MGIIRRIYDVIKNNKTFELTAAPEILGDETCRAMMAAGRSASHIADVLGISFTRCAPTYGTCMKRWRKRSAEGRRVRCRGAGLWLSPHVWHAVTAFLSRACPYAVKARSFQDG